MHYELMPWDVNLYTNHIVPQAPPEQTEPAYSSLSLASFIFGLISPLLVLFCFSSVITSVIAIVCGHKSLRKIKYSRGRLTGRGTALAGLTIGYISLVLTFCFAVVFFNHVASIAAARGNAQLSDSSTPAKKRLSDAEAIIGKPTTVGTGNNSDATEVAVEIATTIQTLYAEAADENGEKLRADESFRVYCEMHNGSCAVIVHVPSYRGYSSQEKKDVADIFWTLSRKAVAGKLRPGDRLAVGLRGTLLYGDVMIGQLASRERNGVNYTRGDRDDLVEFFEPDPAPVQNTRRALAASNSATPDRTEAAKRTRELPAPAPEAPRMNSNPEPPLNPPSIPSQPQRITPSNPIVKAETPKVETPAAPVPATEPEQTPGPKPVSLEDPPNFKNKLTLEKHVVINMQRSPVSSITFLKNDKWLMVGRMDETFAIYDLSSGELIGQPAKIEGASFIQSVKANRNGDVVFITDHRGSPIATKVNKDGSLGKSQALSANFHSITALCASPIHPFVAVGGLDGNLLWQSYDGKNDKQLSLRDLRRKVQAIHLPLKGTQGVATDGNELLTFSLKDASVIKKWPFKDVSYNAAKFNQAGDRVLMLRDRDVLVEHDVATGQPTRVFNFGHHIIHDFEYHSAEAWVLAHGMDKIVVWDASTTEKLAVLDYERPTRNLLYSQGPKESLVVGLPVFPPDTMTVNRIVPVKD